MKTLVAYYSLEGNTKLVAEKIAKKLGADLLCIQPEKVYPTSGIMKYLTGGKDVKMGVKPSLKPLDKDPASYDTIILGTPVWAGSFAAPMRSFLEQNPISGKRVAFFANTAGGSPEKCFANFESSTKDSTTVGKLWLVDPLTRGKDDDDAKIDEFCRKIAE